MNIGEPFNTNGLFRNVLVPRVIAKRTDLTLAAKLVYGELNRHCGKSGRVYPSQETIAVNLGMSIDGVHKAIKQLVELEFLRVIRPQGKAKLHHLHNQYQFLWHASLEEAAKTEDPSEEETHMYCAPRRILYGSVDVFGTGPETDSVRAQYKLGSNELGKEKNCLPHPADAGDGALLPPITFGSPTKPKVKPTPSVEGVPTSHLFKKKYIRMWVLRYPGCDYPFKGGKDGKHFKDLFTYFKGDLAKFKAVARRYLACDEKFFKGHPIAKLTLDLQRFVVEGDPAEQELNNANNSVVGITATEEVRTSDIRELEDEE